MAAKFLTALALALATFLPPSVGAAEPATANNGDVSAGHITGLGGVFVRSRNPKALAAWYRDVLGLKIETWGGAALSYEAAQHPKVMVWSAFSETSAYAAPSKREFMLNFAVDDLDAFLAKLAGKGVTIIGRDDKDPSGRFAWILDPDGTKIELWQARIP